MVSKCGGWARGRGDMTHQDPEPSARGSAATKAAHAAADNHNRCATKRSIRTLLTRMLCCLDARSTTTLSTPMACPTSEFAPGVTLVLDNGEQDLKSTQVRASKQHSLQRAPRQLFGFASLCRWASADIL